RLREPREALGLSRDVEDVERQALPIERAAEKNEIVAELIDDVVDDAIVGSRGGAQHRHAARHEVEDADQPPVVGSEVVPPIADAMGLVDDSRPARAASLVSTVSRKRGFPNRSGATSNRST